MQRPGTAAGDDWFWGGRVLSVGASVRCYRSPHTMQRPGTAAGDDWFWGGRVLSVGAIRIQCSDLGLRLVMTGFGAGRVLSDGASVRCYRSPHTMQRPGTAAGDDWFWGW
ncbi:hypothetical protein NDU88_000126 [Pleurodeles waltl]|uniref:Uncharacterized protein n=1 Tax=Pleurodeles waltl TaxID=8319 RepID=A0AAV7N8R2_PLEWA|nr:hypothetical protein NDU88_000125 [Pleurodeles waltl]KAJ1111854.1 hypothetical protein NDU88_000126 [Pleurodeles waltl]